MTTHTTSASSALLFLAFGIFATGIAAGTFVASTAKTPNSPAPENSGSPQEPPSSGAAPILIRDNGGKDGGSVLIPVQKKCVMQTADEYRKAAQMAVIESLGLAYTESRVALHVLNGSSFAEIAAAVGGSEESVRKVASRVYHKVGVRRRQDLVHIVNKEMARYSEAVAFMPLGYQAPSE